MPWKEVTKMDQRAEFIKFVLRAESNFSALCSRFGISRKTGYKWLKHFKEKESDQNTSFADRSRRPHSHPLVTPPAIQNLILQAREKHPAWGGRKIKAWLESQGNLSIPTASTITKILQRHGYIDKNNIQKQTHWERFEHPYPNDLWQVDFKGYFELHQGQCHPLTILDDHSRFAIALHACEKEDGKTVKNAMIRVFKQYGLPFRMNFDNGHPWGNPKGRYTKFALWLMRLGIRVSYSRIGHPQTNGKDERFHRTLKTELLSFQTFYDLVHAQREFDRWRNIYNHERPHEALGMQTPISRYYPGKRAYPDQLPDLEYDTNCITRTLSDRGYLRFKGAHIFIGKAFCYELVGIKTLPDGENYEVYYGHQKVMSFGEKDLIK